MECSTAKSTYRGIFKKAWGKICFFTIAFQKVYFLDFFAIGNVIKNNPPPANAGAPFAQGGLFNVCLPCAGAAQQTRGWRQSFIYLSLPFLAKGRCRGETVAEGLY